MRDLCQDQSCTNKTAGYNERVSKFTQTSFPVAAVHHAPTALNLEIRESGNPGIWNPGILE